MVGVANSLFQNHRRDGVRFVTGYAAGSLASGVGVGVVLWTIGTMVANVVPWGVRSAVLGLALIPLGALDLTGRTPSKVRQTPQRFARQLGPTPLGLVYGLDLGSVVSTFKVTSMIWAALAGAMLVSVEDTHMVVVALTLPQLVSLGLALTRRGPDDPLFLQSRLVALVKLMRVSSSVLLIGLGGMLLSNGT